MGHVPDHTPAAAAVEHSALIAGLDAGDLAGVERDRAATLAGTCTGCASLLADLAIIRVAIAALPATPRTRDYRLTDADALRLRPSAWGRLVGWLGAPRSTVRPLAGGLAALGIAGLLLSTTPGLFGQAAGALRFTSLPATGAPITAPGEAGGAGGGAAGDARLGAAPSAAASTAAGPDAAATAEPGTIGAPNATSAPGAPDTTPGAAALPAPSPAAVALPAPSPAAVEPPVPSPAAVGLPAPAGPATSPVLTGPAAGATEGPAGFSTDTGAADSGSKATPPEASQGERNAGLVPASELATPDRTLPLVLSLALLVAGIGLFAANRVLRRRAHA